MLYCLVTAVWYGHLNWLCIQSLTHWRSLKEGKCWPVILLLRVKGKLKLWRAHQVQRGDTGWTTCVILFNIINKSESHTLHCLMSEMSQGFFMTVFNHVVCDVKTLGRDSSPKMKIPSLSNHSHAGGKSGEISYPSKHFWSFTWVDDWIYLLGELFL